LILQGIEELKLKSQLIHINIRRVLAAVQPDASPETEWPDGMPSLPVCDSKKLAEMEKFLENKVNRNAVVSDPFSREAF